MELYAFTRDDFEQVLIHYKDLRSALEKHMRSLGNEPGLAQKRWARIRETVYNRRFINGRRRSLRWTNSHSQKSSLLSLLGDSGRRVSPPSPGGTVLDRPSPVSPSGSPRNASDRSSLMAQLSGRNLYRSARQPARRSPSQPVRRSSM